MTGLLDSWQRQVNYLRVSITDFCNLNCSYCTETAGPQLTRADILTYEEIQRLVTIASRLGISKVRLTGGEPLLRPDLAKLIEMISGTPGIDDVALTTNGTVLARFVTQLKEAGLTRVNISLDTLERDRFKAITGHDRLGDVLNGIELATAAGLTPVKINMVVMRGKNEDEIIDFAMNTVELGWNVRYIEYMPFTSADMATVVSAGEIHGRITREVGPLEPYRMKTGNGPARYFRLAGAKGTIGFISPMTEHFCATCNRLRVTADGHLRPCLLDDDEVDVKKVLRDGSSDEQLETTIRRAVGIKRDRHHLNEGIPAPERPMRQIGG
jgi:cyclic pyranopterin phosphate synthase